MPGKATMSALKTGNINTIPNAGAGASGESTVPRSGVPSGKPGNQPMARPSAPSSSQARNGGITGSLNNSYDLQNG